MQRVSIFEKVKELLPGELNFEHYWSNNDEGFPSLNKYKTELGAKDKGDEDPFDTETFLQTNYPSYGWVPKSYLRPVRTNVTALYFSCSDYDTETNKFLTHVKFIKIEDVDDNNNVVGMPFYYYFTGIDQVCTINSDRITYQYKFIIDHWCTNWYIYHNAMKEINPNLYFIYKHMNRFNKGRAGRMSGGFVSDYGMNNWINYVTEPWKGRSNKDFDLMPLSDTNTTLRNIIEINDSNIEKLNSQTIFAVINVMGKQDGDSGWNEKSLWSSGYFTAPYNTFTQNLNYIDIANWNRPSDIIFKFNDENYRFGKYYKYLIIADSAFTNDTIAKKIATDSAITGKGFTVPISTPDSQATDTELVLTGIGGYILIPIPNDTLTLNTDTSTSNAYAFKDYFSYLINNNFIELSKDDGKQLYFGTLDNSTIKGSVILDIAPSQISVMIKNAHQAKYREYDNRKYYEQANSNKIILNQIDSGPEQPNGVVYYRFGETDPYGGLLKNTFLPGFYLDFANLSLIISRNDIIYNRGNYIKMIDDIKEMLTNKDIASVWNDKSEPLCFSPKFRRVQYLIDGTNRLAFGADVIDWSKIFCENWKISMDIFMSTNGSYKVNLGNLANIYYPWNRMKDNLMAYDNRQFPIEFGAWVNWADNSQASFNMGYNNQQQQWAFTASWNEKEHEFSNASAGIQGTIGAIGSGLAGAAEGFMAGGPAGAIAGGAGGLMGGVGNAIGTGMAGNIQYDYNTQMLDLQKQTQQRSWEAQNAQLAKTPASQVIPSYLGGPLSAKDWNYDDGEVGDFKLLTTYEPVEQNLIQLMNDVWLKGYFYLAYDKYSTYDNRRNYNYMAFNLTGRRQELSDRIQRWLDDKNISPLFYAESWISTFFDKLEAGIRLFKVQPHGTEGVISEEIMLSNIENDFDELVWKEDLYIKPPEDNSISDETKWFNPQPDKDAWLYNDGQFWANSPEHFTHRENGNFYSCSYYEWDGNDSYISKNTISNNAGETYTLQSLQIPPGRANTPYHTCTTKLYDSTQKPYASLDDFFADVDNCYIAINLSQKYATEINVTNESYHMPGNITQRFRVELDKTNKRTMYRYDGTENAEKTPSGLPIPGLFNGFNNEANVEFLNQGCVSQSYICGLDITYFNLSLSDYISRCATPSGFTDPINADTDYNGIPDNRKQKAGYNYDNFYFGWIVSLSQGVYGMGEEQSVWTWVPLYATLPIAVEFRYDATFGTVVCDVSCGDTGASTGPYLFTLNSIAQGWYGNQYEYHPEYHFTMGKDMNDFNINFVAETTRWNSSWIQNTPQIIVNGVTLCKDTNYNVTMKSQWMLDLGDIRVSWDGVSYNPRLVSNVPFTSAPLTDEQLAVIFNNSDKLDVGGGISWTYGDGPISLVSFYKDGDGKVHLEINGPQNNDFPMGWLDNGSNVHGLLETFTLTIGEVDVLPTIKDQFTITVEGLQVHNIDKNGDTWTVHSTVSAESYDLSYEQMIAIFNYSDRITGPVGNIDVFYYNSGENILQINKVQNTWSLQWALHSQSEIIPLAEATSNVDNIPNQITLTRG